jgi:hypothetical protein
VALDGRIMAQPRHGRQSRVDRSGVRKV